MIFLNTNFTVLSWVIEFTGSTSVHLVKYFTATNAYFLPLDAKGNDHIMSSLDPII